MVNVTELQASLDGLKAELDQFFLIVMGMVVFLMQCGFAFLEAGSVRRKNTSNILIKNLLDSCVAGIAYWILGFPLAYGEGNAFIGASFWASHDLPTTRFAEWWFQFVFAATAATIVSGALAERCEFAAYFIYSFFITAFIYPVASRWGWAGPGWLRTGAEYTINNQTVSVGYQDFAGSGLVHVLGGASAFVGALCIGPRQGRFSGRAIRGHSTPFAALGGFILLFGFTAFNGGSQLAISNPGDGAAVAVAIVNTIISGSMAAFTTLFIKRVPKFGNSAWSLLDSINGALAGMVAICAGCNAMQPWGAAVTGLVAGVSYLCWSALMVKLKIDDPLDAVAVHFGGGSWGVIAVALFKYSPGNADNGLLTDWDEQALLLLAWQVCGLVCVTLWSVLLCLLLFGGLRLVGLLRVSASVEEEGLDITEHGEPAYPLESNEHLLRLLGMIEGGQLPTHDLGISNGGFSKDQSEVLQQLGDFTTGNDKAAQPNGGSSVARPAAAAATMNANNNDTPM